MSHIWMSHVTHVNESSHISVACHTCEWVTSYTPPQKKQLNGAKKGANISTLVLPTKNAPPPPLHLYAGGKKMTIQAGKKGDDLLNDRCERIEEFVCWWASSCIFCHALHCFVCVNFTNSMNITNSMRYTCSRICTHTLHCFTRMLRYFTHTLRCFVSV